MEYYEETSTETIRIMHPEGKILERPLKVKGMKKQPDSVIQALKSRDVWTIEDLRQLEDW